MALPKKSAEQKIQTAVWQIDLGIGRRILRWSLLMLVAVLVSLIYTAGQFRGLEHREAMDMAQLARNIARGEGFTTQMIRPLSLWQLKTHSASRDPQLMNHPDIYNPPLYPLALATLFKLLPGSVFKYDPAERIYLPERWIILPFNQICFLLSVLLVFLWTNQLFDRRVAITTAVLLLLSDTLWAYSISGLPTNFLMLLILLSIYCLFLADRLLNRPEIPEAEQVDAVPSGVSTGVAALVIGSAILMGLCFLTRYLAAFFVLPMAVYAARVLRGRKGAFWAVAYVLVFLAVIAPWLMRNYRLSASVLGVARYELVDRTSVFVGEELQRSYHPNFENAYSFKPLASKFIRGARQHLLETIKKIDAGFLVFFFAVGLMYGFRRRDSMRLRGLVLGAVFCAIFGMALIGSPPERNSPDINGGNLLVLLYPLVAVFGVAFFYLLLDRVAFRIKLTRGLAIGAFVLANIAPLIFTLLPPRRGLFPYPPYFPPMTHAVVEYFDKNELAVSDLPWAIAWDGDRKAVWLPLTIEEFYELHDFVAPNGFSFLMLTPYMVDQRPQTEIAKGEYKGWTPILRGQFPQAFPLKAYTSVAPENDQLLFADKPRWALTQAEQPAEPKGDKPPAPPLPHLPPQQ